jgi:hypothetical protein
MEVCIGLYLRSNSKPFHSCKPITTNLFSGRNLLVLISLTYSIVEMLIEVKNISSHRTELIKACFF